jgi:hypothetical protein
MFKLVPVQTSATTTAKFSSRGYSPDHTIWKSIVTIFEVAQPYAGLSYETFHRRSWFGILLNSGFYILRHHVEDSIDITEIVEMLHEVGFGLYKQSLIAYVNCVWLSHTHAHNSKTKVVLSYTRFYLTHIRNLSEKF